MLTIDEGSALRIGPKLMAINIVEYLTNVPAGDYNEMVSY
jgi:hypothetical protein